MRFYISASRAVKLVERFLAFERDRALVRGRIEKYRRILSGQTRLKTVASREELRRLFLENAPDLRHNIRIDPWTPVSLPDAAFCWELSDIAVVLDRSPSTLSRSLADLACRRRWRLRLEGLRRAFPPRRTLYADGVFDLLIDYFALSYLERFTTPRSGAAKNDSECREILAYWHFMSENAYMTEEQLLDAAVPGSRPTGEQPPDAGPWADRPQKLRKMALRLGILR